MKAIATFFSILLSLGCGTASGKSSYQPEKQCDDLRRLAVNTPAGFCLALVADGFKFPRGIQPLANGDLIVVDMGGWVKNAGSVWSLKKAGAGYQRTLLLDKLDRPNGITLGPDGLIYVGAVKRIFRFNLADPAHTVRDLIGGSAAVAALPGIGRHLLTSMVFDRHGDLFVNVGSGTDHCEQSGGSAPKPDQPCDEVGGPEPLGVIRKYEIQWPAGSVKRWENYALGLRNSMALAIHPVTGELWQGENGRDAINLAMPLLKNDEDLPHDELNRIERGAHFGWPYCYDNNLPSPEYPRWNCSKYRAPALLLPAHAAPLGMTFYTASQLPPTFNNSLIIGFHGYRKHGHRLVALLPDTAGAPLGKMIELVSGWDARASQPMGAPVAVTVGPDGAIYLTEDRNGTVLRLSYSAKSTVPATSR